MAQLSLSHADTEVPAIQVSPKNNESQPFQFPRQQAMEMIYRQHLDMNCVAYVTIRTNLMPCHLDTEIHLEFVFPD